jgi:DNA invertase Pin-like site-specific DNA recombinase
MKQVVIYGRCSTDKQTVSNQLNDLREVANRSGWEVIDQYLDEGISGSKGRDKRPEFDRLLKDANRKKFDGILVWSVDRLGRSLQHLVSFLNDIQVKDIDLYIHQQGIDTATMTGKMMFQMCGVFAEFERNIIRERVKSGLDRAKKSGKTLGRPTNVSGNTKATVIELRNTGMSMNKICKTLSIGSGTLYRLLDEVA